MTITDLLRKRLLEQRGLPFEDRPPVATSPAEIADRSMSWEFIERMANRMVTGFFRYENKPTGRPTYDHISSMIKRLELYKQDGNLEHMVDVANIAMCEYRFPTHADAHWEAQDDGYHTQKT